MALMSVPSCFRDCSESKESKGKLALLDFQTRSAQSVGCCSCGEEPYAAAYHVARTRCYVKGLLSKARSWWYFIQVPLERLEADFWEIVEKGDEPVDVLYGADLDTSVLGSGFPRPAGTARMPAVKSSSSRAQGSCTKQGKAAAATTRTDLSEEEAAYVDAAWNLNNLPRHEGTHGSLLRHLEDDVAGVVVPWLYVGMLFSSFCWHIEDHMFYSGEPSPRITCVASMPHLPHIHTTAAA